jgi:hypothetical protein
MIGIVSVTSDIRSVRIALLSHHWLEFHTVNRAQDWAGLFAFGYRYAAGDRAFRKDCVVERVAAAEGGVTDPQEERAARRVVCQAELDDLAAVTEVGMYVQAVSQLARQGIYWHGRCLTENEVVAALGVAS